MPSYEEERIAIYSYRASLRWAYVACLMISTLILGGFAVWIELAVKTDDSWYDTYYAILAGLGLSGLVSIFITIFVLEVGTVLADIVGRRKVGERLAKAEAERETEQSESGSRRKTASCEGRSRSRAAPAHNRAQRQRRELKMRASLTEVVEMLADIVGRRKAEERLAKVEAERDAAMADTEAARVKIERLRRIIESRGLDQGRSDTE